MSGALKLKGQDMRLPDAFVSLTRKSQKCQLSRATIGPPFPQGRRTIPNSPYLRTTRVRRGIDLRHATESKPPPSSFLTTKDQSASEWSKRSKLRDT